MSEKPNPFLKQESVSDTSTGKPNPFLGEAKKKYTYSRFRNRCTELLNVARGTIGRWWKNTRNASVGRSEFKIDIAFGFFYFRAWNFYIGWVRK